MKPSPRERVFFDVRARRRPFFPHHGHGRAFTLVEMLVVMAVVVTIIALAAPVISGIKNAGDVNKTVYDLAGILTQARTYATSNSTYVYVGIAEVDAAQSSSATPQVAGKGRVGVAVIASKDGTPGYGFFTPKNDWQSNYAAGKNFLTIGRLQTFENLHLVNLKERPDKGGMARPPLSDDLAITAKYNLGDDECVSVTPFAYPLGAAQGSGRYNFTKVVEFTPQGAARIQYDDNSNVIAPWLEIGMQQSRGSTVGATPSPRQTTGGIAAIQINGATGAVRIYRP